MKTLKLACILSVLIPLFVCCLLIELLFDNSPMWERLRRGRNY